MDVLDRALDDGQGPAGGGEGPAAIQAREETVKGTADPVTKGIWTPQDNPEGKEEENSSDDVEHHPEFLLTQVLAALLIGQKEAPNLRDAVPAGETEADGADGQGDEAAGGDQLPGDTSGGVDIGLLMSGAGQTMGAMLPSGSTSKEHTNAPEVAPEKIGGQGPEGALPEAFEGRAGEPAGPAKRPSTTTGAQENPDNDALTFSDKEKPPAGPGDPVEAREPGGTFTEGAVTEKGKSAGAGGGVAEGMPSRRGEEDGFTIESSSGQDFTPPDHHEQGTGQFGLAMTGQAMAEGAAEKSTRSAVFGDLVADRIARTMEQMIQTNRSDLTMRLRIDGAESLLLDIKDRAGTMMVEIQCRDKTLSKELESQKEAMIRNLESRNMTTTISITRVGDEPRGGSGERQSARREPGRRDQWKEGDAFGPYFETLA